MYLDNWYISYCNLDPYTPPEMQEVQLGGIVTGHPNFTDGDPVLISRIIAHNSINKILTISGNTYELGHPKQEYENSYPNAYYRFFKMLSEQVLLKETL